MILRPHEGWNELNDKERTKLPVPTDDICSIFLQKYQPYKIVLHKLGTLWRRRSWCLLWKSYLLNQNTTPASPLCTSTLQPVRDRQDTQSEVGQCSKKQSRPVVANCSKVLKNHNNGKEKEQSQSTSICLNKGMENKHTHNRKEHYRKTKNQSRQINTETMTRTNYKLRHL